MEDPRDRLVRYVDDARAAEEGIAQVLQGFITETTEPEVRQPLKQALLCTKEHAVRMERRLRELGAEPSAAKGLFNSMMGTLTDPMHGAHDDYDKSTQNVIKAYAAEHLQTGMYAALAAYSRACGDSATAELAEELMARSKDPADQVRPLIAACAADTHAASIREAA